MSFHDKKLGRLGVDADPVVDAVDLIFAYGQAATTQNERLLYATRAMRLVNHTNRVELEKRRFESQATTDVLTGLKNRRGMMEIMQRRIDDIRRHPSKAMIVALVDLDGFKALNDNCGHERGDEALKEVGQRLKAAFRTTDVVCRAGGDEIVILFPLEAGEGLSKTVIKAKVRQAMEGLVYYNDAGQPFPVGASIGAHMMCGRDIAKMTDLSAQDIGESAILIADAAMYNDKWFEGNAENLSGGASDPRHPKNMRLQRAREAAVSNLDLDLGNN